MPKVLASGLVHSVPGDLGKMLKLNNQALDAWQNITILARNEWLCWIESAKMVETRNRRINRMLVDLTKGKKRPCCWAGCPHR